MSATPSGPDAAARGDGTGRMIAALVVSQVCLHGAMAGIRLALPLMVLHQGTRYGIPAEMAAGLLLGLFAAVPVLTAVHAGRWTDRRGYHRPLRAAVWMLMSGAVLATLGCAWPAEPGSSALVLLPHVLLLVAGAALVGTGCNLGLITMQRSAAGVARWGLPADAPLPPGALQRVFSWTGMAPSIANAVGPLLAGLLIDAAGYPIACALLGLLPLGAHWCARRVPPELAPGRQQAAGQAAAPRHKLRELLLLPGIPGILVVNWFFSGSWDLHAFLVPLLGTRLGLSASAIGSVLGVFSVSVTLIRMVSPWLAGRWAEHQVLGAAMGLVALVFFVYPWTTGALTMGLCAITLGLALGVAQPMILGTLHQLAPPGQEGEVIALRSAVINLSGTLLPALFGVLGGVLGPALLFQGMGLLVLLNVWQPRRLARVIAASQQRRE